MKYFFTFSAILFAVFMLNAQSGSVNGQLLDNNNVAIEGANIVIKSIAKGSVSDASGNFTLTAIPDGSYTLTISFIGYRDQNQTIKITNGNTVDLGTITVYEGNELLESVTVTSRNNKFSRKKTAYVSKLPLKDIENSQVYSTVTSELLESQVVTNIDDALVNATGVNKLWEATGRSGEGTGFFSIRGFSAQPGIVDGVPGYTFSALDPSYIERIEVLKGPSATLFGSTVTSLGGLINVVTKKPYDGFGGSLSYTGGSFNTHRVSADFNTALGDSKTKFFRLNASYLTQDSFQDAGFKKTFFVAPSFTFKVNDRLTFNAGIEYSKTKQTNPAMLFLRRGYPMVSNTVEDFGINPDKSFTDNDVFLENPTFSTRIIGDYKISDKWKSQTIFAASRSEAKGYYQYLLEGAAVQFLNPNAQTPQEIAQNQFIQQYLQQDVLTRIIDKRNANSLTSNLQQNFIGDFKIGKLRNRMVIGLDYVSQSSRNRNRAINPLTQLPVVYGFFSPDGTVLDDIFFTPTFPETSYPINRGILDPIFNQIPANNIHTASRTLAGYVSNVINISPSLSAMVGLRVDYFDQDGDKSVKEDDYNKTNFSPKFGVVYQPILNKLSVFANYQTGFVNTDPVVSTIGGNVVVQTFKPQEAEQFEGGVKTNLFDKKLNLGVSYYNIAVNNRPTLDPFNPTAQVTIDEVRSKGVEVELNANPIPGMNIRGSFAHNDSEIAKTQYTVILGKRPIEAGPQNLYNLWVDYKFQNFNSPILKNIGVGAGFNGASKAIATDNVISGQFTLPDYMLFNASIYYEAKTFRVGVKANNLTDETYYRGWGTVNPQAPRSFLGTVTYKF